MKKSLYILLPAIAAGLFLTACNEKAATIDESNPPLSIEAEAVSVKDGETVELKIMSGGGTYTAVPADAELVRVSVSGNRIALTGGQVGEDTRQTSVTVCDQYGQEAQFAVEVVSLIQPLVLSRTEVGLNVDIAGKKEVEITIEQGNGNFIFDITEGDDKIELVTDNVETARRFTIRSVAAGTAKVRVSEANTSRTAQIDVLVEELADITVDKTSLTFAGPQATPQEIRILTGNGDYGLSVDNPTLVRLSMENNAITVIPTGVGSITLKIKDYADKEIDIPITVNGGNHAFNMLTSYYCYTNLAANLGEGNTTVQTLTFEVRCKFSSFTNNSMVIGLESNIVLKLNGTNGSLKIAGVGGALTLQTAANSLKLDEWVHIAMTYDNSKTGNDKYELYFDGVKQDLTDGKSPSQIHNGIDLTSANNSNGNLQIGRAGTNSGTRPDYAVDEVRVWTVARGQSQIQQNMNGLVETEPAGLLGCWDFNVAAATDYIIDRSSYRNDLTIAQLSNNAVVPPAVTVSAGDFVALP